MSSIPLQQASAARVSPPYYAVRVFSEDASPLAKLGVWLLAFYIFLAYSRVPELLIDRFGAVPVMPATMGVVLLASILTGGVFRFRSHPSLLLMVAYYGWMLLSVPFSIWKGGSVGIVIYQLKLALICFALLSIVDRLGDLKKVMVAISLSIIVLVTVGNQIESNAGRFQFESGSLSNPNELANHFLIGLPLAWSVGIGAGAFSPRSILRFVVVVAAAIILAKTGSRGGLIAGGSMALALLLTLSFPNKVKLLLVGGIISVVAVAFAPDYAVKRLKTIFSEGDADLGEASQSSASRKELLRASISITLRNPIFGVGPANFVVAFNDDLLEEGKQHHWEATHNAYTQVSSEMGIPTLSFYVATFFTSMRRLWRLRRSVKGIPQLRHLFQLTSLLSLSMLAYLVSGLFTSNAHQYYFPLLVGLAITLEYCGRKEVDHPLLNGHTSPHVPPVRS